MSKLLADKLIFFDGGMGTMLNCSDPLLANRQEPDKVLAVHKAYAKAGADIITANTFGANPLKLCGDYTTEQAVTDALNIAKKTGKKVALDVGPTGRLLKPVGELDFETAYQSFKRVILAGKDADMILIETMTDLYEVKAALLAAKENSDLPVAVTVSVDKDGMLVTGADILTAITLIESMGADALGLNCGLGAEQFDKFLPDILKYSSIPVMLQPNAGLPTVKDGETVYDTSPEQFAMYMKKFAEMGVGILGGCCGTTPEHIRLMREYCKEITPKPIEKKNYTAVCSGTKTVFFGEKPVIIGERINPTGKKKFKEALRRHDINYITEEAYRQIASGADILDVNVGLPEIDEKEVMQSAVMAISAMSCAPLQLDSASPKVLESAMRIYPGKPMVNSVNGKQEVMDAVFPLVKKYGGAVVALTLDENGIPSSCEERIRIAEKIIAEAQKYGIGKKDIIVDPLTLSVSSNPFESAQTIPAVQKLRQMGINTVLGVSNISFGLPERENVNAVFFSSALYAGLSAAIINPMSEKMMNTYYAYNALSGHDTGCAEYTAHFTGTDTSAEKKQISEISLHDAIVNGLADKAGELTLKMLDGMSALDIINQIIIPALNRVGDDFESGKIFLPGLLSAAQSAKCAFEIIKNKCPSAKTDGGKVIMATVKGDIHDIGKNIVVMLLQNYGFDVLDLGKDVDGETILNAVKKHGVTLVGLSALMTTTVKSMEEIIKLLKDKAPECKIMVGGAVMTQEYADMIGADFYGKDALCSVNYAQKVL